MNVDCVIVLGGPAWETSANQTSMQTARALSTSVPVFYVSRTDPRPIRARISGLTSRSKGTKRSRVVPEGHELILVGLPVWADWLPLVRPALTRTVVRRILMRRIEAQLRLRGLSQPGLIAYWWMFPEIVKSATWVWRVFDVIDRHWDYAWLRDDHERDVNLDLAVKSARAADRVVAVTGGLASELSSKAAIPVDVLPNSVDMQRVNAIFTDVPRAKRSRNGKSAVYVGGWNERVDVQLFERIVAEQADWDFVVIGGGSEPSPAFARDNVSFLGDLDYDSAMKVMATASVGMLPFLDNEYTRASSFLKAFDYLAAGLAVIATPFEATQRLATEHPEVVTVLPADDWSDYFRGERWASDVVVELDRLPSTMKRAHQLIDDLGTAVSSKKHLDVSGNAA